MRNPKDIAVSEAESLLEKTKQALKIFDYQAFKESEVQGRYDCVRWALLMVHNEVNDMLRSWRES